MSADSRYLGIALSFEHYVERCNCLGYMIVQSKKKKTNRPKIFIKEEDKIVINSEIPIWFFSAVYVSPVETQPI